MENTMSHRVNIEGTSRDTYNGIVPSLRLEGFGGVL